MLFTNKRPAQQKYGNDVLDRDRADMSLRVAPRIIAQHNEAIVAMSFLARWWLFG